MELQIFSFIEEVTEYLQSLKGELESASDDIEEYFEEVLFSDQEPLNINSRVKSVSSLKEKILRNNYYKKYESPEGLISNLSDLIGIRVECRFIEDEKKVYKRLKEHFNKKHSDGYYYNGLNKNLRLDLGSKQPQKQKNGFQIFRIDGVYEYNNKIINFELQIKSLVNMFWGEIEHKIIYKNNNYTMRDRFFKDIMVSIKKNLSMIDNQLLLIYNQFTESNAINTTSRMLQLETILSKIIHDIFATRMKSSIGFIVDFRKSCDTIMKYIFRSNNAENLEDYHKTLIKTLSRLNDIAKNEVDFNSEIKFEREIFLDDEFSSVIGNKILKSINSDFQWNLFFRVLFEIELGNNAEDFETFIEFLRNRFYGNKSFSKLYSLFEEEEVQAIVDSLMKKVICSFQKVDSITYIYDNSIEEINKAAESIVDLICNNISLYDQWEELKVAYLELFELKILSIFDYKVDTMKVKDLIVKIRDCVPKTEIEVEMGTLKYIDKLETSTKIEADDVLKLIKV